ncbi:type II toxin-antitoxin system VapC family toxin [Devosia sp. Leaf64]|uniref:PIN domain-containing protein n=1 Tax=Devosia sp. Leaf64 TaxID=1736229 RepID=UPI0007144167|nr:type II toxin-antitoxin system VapC family toxin [Devosia sp. Leaf64]KQN77299.1 hypothetical protein ASE94_17535 [Devosia sp. Leaf64]
MLGVDTNVLVRFFVRDDEDQFSQAERLIGGAGSGTLFISPIVMVELNWVLRRVYRYSRQEVMDVLQGMTEFRQFQLGKREMITEALSLASASGVDFSDALIALLDREAGCTATVTFDVRALRLEQMLAVGEALN